MPLSPRIFFPLALALAVTHWVALQMQLYWYVPWLDILMHTWGGFLVVYGILMFQVIGSRRVVLERHWVFLILVIVMSGWELFEFGYVIDYTQHNVVLDTILDLVFGGLGGIGASMLARGK
jgi:hypothetical protein